MNDMLIYECAQYLTRNPTDHSYAIVVKDIDNLPEEFIFPLCMEGVTSVLDIHTHTQEEFDSLVLERIELTAANLDWDHSSTTFAEQENPTTIFQGKVVDPDAVSRGINMVINALTCAIPTDDVTHDDNFENFLESHVHVYSMQAEYLLSSGTVTSYGSNPVEHLNLDKRWSITPERAKKTIRNTIQRGERNCLYPSVANLFPTNYRILRYNRLPHTLFNETLLSGTPSSRLNNYVQVFASSYGWSCFYCMRCKDGAHEAFFLQFKRDGFLLDMVADGSKEQTLGNSKRKCKDDDCLLNHIEPHLPWTNTAEAGMRELKHGSYWKMIKSQIPKKL